MNRSLFLTFLLAASPMVGCTIITDNVVEDVLSCRDAADGTVCGNEFDDGIDRICVASECVEFGCGDGFADAMAGEACDDGNDVSGDGCEADCTYSCTSDAECDDGQVCSGSELCDLTTHACTVGVAVVCTPSDACHTSSCTEESGGMCEEVLIDVDGDGVAASSLGACGTDCDDGNPERRPGLPDICGDGIDNDCDPATADNTQTTWYADCDGDGYALLGANTMMACAKPPLVTGTGCAGGSVGDWTYLNPNTTATRDCADSAALAYPGASAWHTDTVPGIGGYNWNCQDGTEYRYGNGNFTCKPIRFGCVGSKSVCCYTSTSYYRWTDMSYPGCNVAESMTLCGSTGSPNPCGDTVSVTQSCR